jgi:hypothetical protein
MPTLLSTPVDIAVAEFVPSRSGQGAWGPPVDSARSALLPTVGEFITLGDDRLLRVTAIRVDLLAGRQRIVLYGAKVNQPNLP